MGRFLFIVPIVLYLFGKTGALDSMRIHLGRFGEPSFLVLLFFAFLNNLPLNFLVAASVVLLGIQLSHLKRCRFTVQLRLLLVLPVAFLIFNHLTQ